MIVRKQSTREEESQKPKYIHLMIYYTSSETPAI